MKKYKFTDMKSMLRLLAFFCSVLLTFLVNKSYSQVFITPNNSFGTNEHRRAPDSVQYVPTFPIAPTDTMNLHSQGFGGKGEKKKMAAIYYDSAHHKGYWWDPALKAWLDMGTGAIDTIIITPVGVGSPQIQTLWTTPDGNERTARLVPGLYIIPFINPDSGVGFKADTSNLATWLKIVAQYGPPMGGSGTNIYNSDGTLTGNRHLNMSGTHSLHLDSTFDFEIKTSTTGTPITAFRVGNNSGTAVVTMGDVDNASGHTNLIVDDPNNQVAILTQGVFKFRGNVGTANPVNLKTQLGAPEYTLYFPTSENFFQLDTLARLKDLRDGIAGSGSTNVNIGAAYRFAVPGTNNIKTLACTGCTLDSATTGQIGITITNPSSRPTSTVSSPTTFSLVAGDVIDYIWVDPTNTTTGFQIGTTPTGSDIVPTQTLASSSKNNFLVGYRATASTTLYFQGIGSSTVITLIKRQ